MMNNTLRRILVVSMLGWLAACNGVGPGAPSPESLIQGHIEAAYNGEGLSARPSVAMEGRLVIEDFDVEAPLTMKIKAPDKRYFETEVMGETVVRSCKEGECWAREIGQQMESLHGKQLDFMAEIADFHRLENLRKYYRHLETAGVAEFNGESAYELRLFRDNGQQDRWYFSRDTGLWLGGTWHLPREMGGMQVTQYFDAYRDFDGVKIATEVTEVTPEQTSKVIIEDVEFATIPDTQFEPRG